MTASTTVLVFAILLVLCQLLSTLPVSRADSLCTNGYCDLDSSPGCGTCLANSSDCSTAWYNQPGISCGQSVLISQQSGNRYTYPACCPTAYPCVANSFTLVDKDVTYDATSFWCRNKSATSVHVTRNLTWLWYCLVFGGSLLLSVGLYLYRRYRYRTIMAAYQQQLQQMDGPPQQELIGQPGPWSQEAQQQQHQQQQQEYQQYQQQQQQQQQVPMPARFMPSYLPPGTYVQMP